MSALTRTIRRRYFGRVETEESAIDERANVALRTNIIDVDDDDDENNNNNGSNRNQISTYNTNTNTSRNTTAETITSDDATSIPLAVPFEDDDDDDDDEEEEENDTDDSDTTFFASLSELVEERDNATRQSSSTVMVGSYFLVMLWLQSIVSKNGFLLMITLALSCWFVQYVGDAHTQINAMNAMILHWDDYATNSGSSIGRSNSGVGELVKRGWDKFLFTSRASLTRKENFGNSTNMDKGNNSLFKKDEDDNDINEDEVDRLKKKKDSSEIPQEEEEEDPVCSICLDEYEKGEELVSLHPCRHVFHEECISAWTNHNTRCPLCNFDLSAVHVAADTMV